MSKDISKTVGANLKVVRLKLGFSQDHLSKLSGVHEVALSRYEGGHLTPNLETLYKLSVAMQVPISSLLKGL